MQQKQTDIDTIAKEYDKICKALSIVYLACMIIL